MFGEGEGEGEGEVFGEGRVNLSYVQANLNISSNKLLCFANKIDDRVPRRERIRQLSIPDLTTTFPHIFRLTLPFS